MKGLVKGVLLIGLLTGCQATEEADVKPLQLAESTIIEQNHADEAKQIVLSMEEVIEVKGVNDEENIYLAVDVKHFDRFRLKEIRKQGHDAVKKRYPHANVHLSTDRKIFIELGKLEQELKQKKISEQRFKEKLKKTEEMMKG